MGIVRDINWWLLIAGLAGVGILIWIDEVLR
jgi:hypothetical protein